MTITRHDIAEGRRERRRQRREARAAVRLVPNEAPPPFPWNIEWLGGYAYVVDATGRRIMSLLGTQKQREHVAEIICALKAEAP